VPVGARTRVLSPKTPEGDWAEARDARGLPWWGSPGEEYALLVARVASFAGVWALNPRPGRRGFGAVRTGLELSPGVHAPAGR
jgi:hypothetical protein